MTGQIILRVQSPEHGTKRFQVKLTDRVQQFLDQVQKEFSLGDIGWVIYQGRDKTGEIRTSRSKTLSHYKLKHGDMLYLVPTQKGGSSGAPSPMQTDSVSAPSFPEVAPSSSSSASSGAASAANVVEDEVDQILSKQDGRIARERNEQLCRHGPAGKCFHCVPLEPYDEQYLKQADPPIKFLSFHSYIRKMTGGVDKGKFATLENISCRIKPGCTEHPPWPGGICTKCVPSAVTLNRQKYRHVDYVQFENPYIAECFLNYWRKSGNQRIGILYGRYETHKDVPLGIKAVVAAIYEPPQISSKHSIELLEDSREEEVNRVAAKLGLRKVGWMFTDLLAQDMKKGTVKHFRGHMDSHFISAEECIMAADFQNKNPSSCKLSSEGHFGSKFVTVVVTGDSSNQIHFDAYQVSNQCMALVRDDCLIPTKDASEFGYIKESSNSQYVPDVFYKEKDSYGNEVTRLGRPLPVEYLLVDMPVAFPVEPKFTFHAADGYKPFPIDNRHEVDEYQDFNNFCTYMSQFEPEQFLDAVSDFHLLVYLNACDMLPLKDHMDSLLEAVKNQDKEVAHHWRKTEEWGTVEQLMEAHAPSPPVSRQGSYVGPNPSPLPPIGSTRWTCKHCTFANPANLTSCEMCSLPK